MLPSTLRPNRVAALLAAVCALTPAGSATASVPTYGSAVVDGDPAEWDLGADYYADMHRAGNAGQPLESKAYVRYDCDTMTAYVLVLTEDGVPALVDGDAWVAIDAVNNKVVENESGTDGTPPDFAWYDAGYDGDANHARGFEASFLLAQGTYETIIHVNVFDDGGAQTSATLGFRNSGPELSVNCAAPVEPTTWSRVKAFYR